MGDRFKPESVIGMGQNMHPASVLCGPYSGTYIIDTDASAFYSDSYVESYNLYSGIITLANGSVGYDGVLTIANDFGALDSLLITLAGDFKIVFEAPIGTIEDTLLTEANIMALMDNASSVYAYRKTSGDNPFDPNPIITERYQSQNPLVSLC